MLRSMSRAQGSRILSTRSASTSSPVTPAGSPTAPSLTQNKKWTRPVEPGTLTAYDEALAYIQQDSERLRNELFRRRAAKDEDWSAAELEKLEIESEINLPGVRWNFTEGSLDLSKPVYRHLLDQQWRKKGRLDRLMERVHLMNVVPDVIPAIRPNVDLRVNFASSSSPNIHPAESHQVPAKKLAHNNADPAPEHFLLPSQTITPPKVTAQVFHPHAKLYTLIMIDPDVPDAAGKTFQTYLHWLVPNISLSATSKDVVIPTTQPSPVVTYIPPHPQNGTPAHRYVLLMLPQSSEITLPSDLTRLGFDLRKFVAQHSLLRYVFSSSTRETTQSGDKISPIKKVEAEEGGGIAMWREEWDASVSLIYDKILKSSEPRFGLPKPLDPYADEQGNKYPKYPFVMSSFGSHFAEDVTFTESVLGDGNTQIPHAGDEQPSATV